MNLFVTEIVTPPEHLPVTVADAQLAAAVVEEIERTVLWRAIVAQTRRIIVDYLPPRIELEPLTAIVSITNAAAVVDSASYVYPRSGRHYHRARCPVPTGPPQNAQSEVSTLTYDSGVGSHAGDPLPALVTALT